MGVVIEVRAVLAVERPEAARLKAVVAALIDGGYVSGSVVVEIGDVCDAGVAYRRVDDVPAGARQLYAGIEREAVLEALDGAGEDDLRVWFVHLNAGALEPDEGPDDSEAGPRRAEPIRADAWLGERFMALLSVRTPRPIAVVDAYASEDEQPPPIGPACAWIEIDGKDAPAEGIEGSRLAACLADHGLGPKETVLGAW